MQLHATLYGRSKQRSTFFVVVGDLRLRVQLVFVVVGEIHLACVLMLERRRRSADCFDCFLLGCDHFLANIFKRFDLVLEIGRQLVDLSLPRSRALALTRCVQLLQALVDLADEFVAFVGQFFELFMVGARILRRTEQRKLLLDRPRGLVETRNQLGRLLHQFVVPLVVHSWRVSRDVAIAHTTVVVGALGNKNKNCKTDGCTTKHRQQWRSSSSLADPTTTRRR